MHKPLALALTLALALPAAAADGARATAVAPFLDDATFAVVHIDVTRLKAGDLATALGKLGGVDADAVDALAQTAGRWADDFTKAGGKDLYLVFSFTDYGHSPFVVVPLGDKADAKAIGELLDRTGFVPEGPREKVGAALFAGNKTTLERVRANKPAARPELAKAFGAAGDGAVQAVLVPPPHLARVVDEMLPALPKEWGGGPSKPLTHGVRWAAVGLDAPPKLALRLVVQSPDAASAKALDGALGKLVKAVARQKDVREALPGIDKAAELLVPKVADDRLVLTLEGKELTAALGPPAVRLREALAQQRDAAHLRQLTRAAHEYTDAHGTMPAVASFDKGGKPLLSWRVHLLPYLGEKALYKQFHLDEPWDSDHNKKLLAKMPVVYRGLSGKLNEQGKTTYLAPVGKEAAFSGEAKGRRFPAEFTDGTSNTILFVDADDARAVEWTRPEDLKVDLDKPHAGLARLAGYFLLGLADGSVHSVKATVSKETLRAAFTPNGGEVLGADW